jgi:hypothetical protein
MLHIKPTRFLLYIYIKYNILDAEQLQSFIENNDIILYGTNKLEKDYKLNKKIYLPVQYGKYENMLRAYAFNIDLINFNMSLLKNSKKLMNKDQYKNLANLELEKKKKYAIFRPYNDIPNNFTKYEFFYITNKKLIKDICNFYNEYQLPYEVKLHYKLYKDICYYYNNLMINHQTFKVYLLNYIFDTDTSYKYYQILYQIQLQKTFKYKVINNIINKIKNKFT